MNLQREHTEDERKLLAEFERCSMRMTELMYQLRNIMTREYAFHHIRHTTYNLNELPVMNQEAWDKSLES